MPTDIIELLDTLLDGAGSFAEHLRQKLSPFFGKSLPAANDGMIAGTEYEWLLGLGKAFQTNLAEPWLILTLRPILQTEFFDKLSRPWPVTRGEAMDLLCDVLVPHLIAGDANLFAESQFKLRFQRFRRRIFGRLFLIMDGVAFGRGMVQSAPEGNSKKARRVRKLWKDVRCREGIPIPMGKIDAPFDPRDLRMDDHLYLGYCDRFGLPLRGAGLPSREKMTAENGTDVWILYVGINIAGISARALKDFRDELGPLVRSIVRSHMAAVLPEYRIELAEKLPDLSISLPLDEESGHEPWREGAAFAATQPESGGDEMGWHVRRFASECLKIFYGEARDGTIDERLQSALRFLVEADHQRHPAVAMALCFAAIEAMLVDGETTTRVLAENCAVVLEGEPDRRARAEHYVRRLYEYRSNAVHGRRLADDPLSYQRCRRLAACVLKALLQRRLYLRTAGIRETHEGFFTELQDAVHKKQSIQGISYLPEWNWG